MHSPRINLLALVLFCTNTLVAMEGQGQPTAPPRVITVQDILSRACSQSEPLTSEALAQYGAALDTTIELKNLITADQPQQLKMTMDGLSEIIQETDTVLTEQYLKTWAPRTGASAVACCLLESVKPCAAGWLDWLPSHEATILLGGFWAAEVKERKAERTCINNAFTVLRMTDTKAAKIIRPKLETWKKSQVETTQNSNNDDETKKDK